jgi:hypothetical protein
VETVPRRILGYIDKIRARSAAYIKIYIKRINGRDAKHASCLPGMSLADAS